MVWNPAMAAGIAEYVWGIDELVGYPQVTALDNVKDDMLDRELEPLLCGHAWRRWKTR